MANKCNSRGCENCNQKHHTCICDAASVILSGVLRRIISMAMEKDISCAIKNYGFNY